MKYPTLSKSIHNCIKLGISFNFWIIFIPKRYDGTWETGYPKLSLSFSRRRNRQSKVYYTDEAKIYNNNEEVQ